MDLTVRTARNPFRGEITVPADKSISHRSVLLGSLAEGETRVEGFCPSADCLSTLRCMQALGVQTRWESSRKLSISGKGLYGLTEPEDVLDAGNSATALRLLCGILAAQPFYSVLCGDDSLRKRPMKRVVEPLREMGATVLGRDQGQRAPLTIVGGRLSSIHYTLPIASAQVKSALLLAGLYAEGTTVIREPHTSRDHTERMLEWMGASIHRLPKEIHIEGRHPLRPVSMTVPGDLSSAAFWLVAALMVPGSDVTVRRVGINFTRTGILEALQAMGARLMIHNLREESNEPVADLCIQSSALRGIQLGGGIIPRIIDELPILAVAATRAEGATVVRDAQELRVKETDRISAIVSELRKMGANIAERPDGFLIEGPTELRGARCSSFGDHRIAMSLAIAGLAARGETIITDAECIGASYPGFVSVLKHCSEHQDVTTD